MINKKKLLARFLKYVAVDTQSNNHSLSTPSTQGQLVLAKMLADEMEAMGLSQVSLSSSGFAYGLLPRNHQGDYPAIGLMAHLDTYCDFPGQSVNPVVHDAYKGGHLIINSTLQKSIDPALFPELNQYIGHQIVTTDGTSLLGADDKGGIAIILSTIEYLIDHPEINHGDIYIAFSPDEEIDRGGIDSLDLDRMPVDFIITVDGDGVHELNFENFNAASGKVVIVGRSVHTGEAKGKMLNACYIANELLSLIPKGMRAEETEGYEGFIHLDDIQGSVAFCEMTFSIRDFEQQGLEDKKQLLAKIVQKLEGIYTGATITLSLQDDYINMKNCISQFSGLQELICSAYEKTGHTPIILPIRGGTDGAMLAVKGLAAPNLFIGGHNYHGELEYVSVDAMALSSQALIHCFELSRRDM
jgi:tripeptide aminopeptidase